MQIIWTFCFFPGLTEGYPRDNGTGKQEDSDASMTEDIPNQNVVHVVGQQET